jgi:hypothetical protein
VDIESLDSVGGADFRVRGVSSRYCEFGRYGEGASHGGSARRVSFRRAWGGRKRVGHGGPQACGGVRYVGGCCGSRDSGIVWSGVCLRVHSAVASPDRIRAGEDQAEVM